MPSYSFAPRVRFVWRRQVFEVEQVTTHRQVVIVEVASGWVQTLALAELEAALFAGDLQFEMRGRAARPATNPTQLSTTPYFYTTDDCPAHLLILAERRLEVIEPLLPLRPGERTKAVITARIEAVKQTFSAQAWQELHCPKLSRATIYRWIHYYLESGGDVRALIPHTAQCGAKGQQRLRPELEYLITTYFEELKGLRTKRTLDHIYDELLLRIQEINAQGAPREGLRPPAKSTVARRWAAFKRQNKLADKSARQYSQFNSVEAPLDRVEIDHTLTDLIVVDDADHLPLGRLVLSICIDVKTRYPLGYYLGFEGYSYAAVSACLYHAIQPKKDTRTVYNTQNAWQAYGIPSLLITDNGKEFIGHHLKDACQALGIRVEQTPIRTPQLKPHIERFFGTLNTNLFHVAPGTTFSNIQQRGGYDSAKAACVYLSQVDQLLTTFIVDIYAESYHSGLQGIPARHWEQALQQGFTPRLPANVNELRILLGHLMERTISSHGIEFQYLRYNTPALLSLRLRGNHQKVKVKYLPNDLSRVYVYDPFEQQYIEVPALDQAYTQGLSLWKHKLIVQHARQISDTVDHTNLAHARRQLQHLFEEGAERRLRSRRQKPQHPTATLTSSGKPSSVPRLHSSLSEEDLAALMHENEQAALRWKTQQPKQSSS